ncbi:MAG: hypothetical protein M1818_006147 [Claussenomyces sp. TS43310]|nr:MAG: hypothetical protein M1818_006147 [Claussenomyces sp. TS43310]
MGKSHRKGHNKGRSNPIAKPIKPPSDPELAAIRETQILPVVNDLQSPDTKKRGSAAVAIANIIEDAKCRKLLLREQIVRILLEQTITDSSLESSSAGWGILRNLALEEEADFCIHLYRQDILTAIEAVAQTMITTIESQEPPVSKLPRAQQDLVWTLSGSIVGLVSSLAEAQEEIVEVITRRPSIIRFLFALLSYDFIPGELFEIALSCLAVLTEDNEDLAKQIVDHESWLKGLMQLQQVGKPGAVGACGVLHNIFSAMQWFDHNTPVEGASDAMLIPTLMECVSTYQRRLDHANGSAQSSPDQVLQLALEMTASIATSLQEALEHANQNEKEFEGFGDEKIDEDEMMIEDGSDDEKGSGDGEEAADDEMDDDAIEADMAMVAGADDDDNDDMPGQQPTLEALISIAAPTILSLAKPSHDEAAERGAVRNSALSALNNISWTVSSVDFSSGKSSIAKSWPPLAQRIWTEAVSPVLASNTADIALASSITSLGWAVARSVQGSVALQADEHRKFMALYQASKNLETPASDSDDDAFQGLGVKCLGVLGRLALTPAPLALNREVGIFLLTVLAGLPATPAADAVEALNQVFDIYADREYDCDKIYWDNDFQKHLEQVQPLARKMAKAIDKRKRPELRQRADEAVLNLDRFLKYKKGEKRA